MVLRFFYYRTSILIHRAPDINLLTKTALREQDSGSADYFGGDVYRHIRISVLNDDVPRKCKWLAKLSPGKRRYVIRFETSKIMSNVMAGLDALIPFTGLWPDFKLGTLQRILKIHCPEACCLYFSDI